MTEEVAIPLELKYDFAMKAWISVLKGFLYAIRKKYGTAAALETYEMLCKMDDRYKNLTNRFLTIFKLVGNDAETIAKWFDIWFALTETEHTILERSKTINRIKVTKCPFKTDYKDISDWNLPFCNIIVKTINPTATLERPKAMCAGDSYCEYIFKIEERIQIKGKDEAMAEKVAIPWELKYDFAMKAWASNLKGFLYAIRKKYGAAATLEMYEMLCKMGDRYKNLTNRFLTIFKIEGCDAETIGKWYAIWGELTGTEGTIIEQSKSFRRSKVTKCPFKIDYKDISGWCLIPTNIIAKTINPKAIHERPNSMCAGDPYCESVYKIEE